MQMGESEFIGKQDIIAFVGQLPAQLLHRRSFLCR
jgi:hypothetical protein